jgi:glycosyltransferase involved in cell wall biosynthesis
LRVLTFNSHQPYVHLLAVSLPWTIGVVIPRTPRGTPKPWDARIRPLPSNVRLYGSVRDALLDAPWDCFLSHNAHDLMESREAGLPGILVVHGTLSGRIVQDGVTIDREGYIDSMKTLLRLTRSRVVYISELKQRDWGIPGTVIRSAVDPEQYGGYQGRRAAVLQVCNHFRERGAILGWEAHREACRGIESLIIGANPRLPGSRVSQSWDDLKEQYRSFRVYLHTAVHPYEDGFNLSVLEAMATGMPVATIAHPTSPIRDNLEGVVSDSPMQLREKILRLLDDTDEAARLGQGARQRLTEVFPIETFRREWDSAAGLCR